MSSHAYCTNIYYSITSINTGISHANVNTMFSSLLKIAENKEKVKLNKHLPYLISTIVENLEVNLEEDGENVDLDSQRNGKSIVLKTSTPQTLYELIVGCFIAKDAHRQETCSTHHRDRGELGILRFRRTDFSPRLSRLKATDPEGSEALVHVSSEWGVAQGLGFPNPSVGGGSMVAGPTFPEASMVVPRFDRKFMGSGDELVAELSIRYVFFWKNDRCFANTRKTKKRAREKSWSSEGKKINFDESP
ncbi:hypothetical protein LguiA_026479 [Lonicera macranthoides]